MLANSPALIRSDLVTFLDKSRDEPWVWGKSDCAMWVANWVLLATGKDVATVYRGRYSSDMECRRLVHAYGGLVPLLTKAFDLVLSRTENQKSLPGDVAIVRVPYKSRLKQRVMNRPAMAICVPPGWAVRTSDMGLLVTGLPVLLSWRIPAPWQK